MPQPGNFAARWSAAMQAFASGNLAQARSECDAALQFDPHHAEALHLRAMIAYRLADHQTALAYIRRAIKKDPRNSAFHNSHGIIHQALQQADKAGQAFREAIQLDPANALAQHNLGDLYHGTGQTAAAELCYRAALRCQPDFAEAHNNLGLLLAGRQCYDEAMEHLAAAIRLRPDYEKPYYSLAHILRDLHRYEEAQEWLEKILIIRPDYAEAWHDLGLNLKAQGDSTAAIRAIEKALQLNPQLTQGYLNLGNFYYEAGLADVARSYFARACAITPTDALKMRMALLVPGVYESTAQISTERTRLTTALAQLQAENLRIADPNEEVALTPFYLAYQGANERELLSRIADLFLHASPELGFVAPHCQTAASVSLSESRRIETGFVSSFFGLPDHIVNRVVAGVIANWPRDRFRITVIHTDSPCPAITQTLQDGDRLLRVSSVLAEARQQIAAAELDMLFYTDLGLEPWSYFLSFARLAPIQLTSGGHPITSGVPNVDYFISSALDEVPQAQEHYRERLVQLPDRPVCYFPVETPTQTKTRADFGLSEQQHIYLCPMTPFKLHPETDQLFAEILRADADGELVFVLNRQTELWERLQTRFAQVMPDVTARIRYLPFMPMADFVALLRLADVVLDTPVFNGGTTSLETLAVGTPIVTLPGEQYRQRVTYGLYNRMGWYECVAKDAADYVRLAVEIARDSERRAALSQEILARNHVLFGQTEGIRQIADFLLSEWEARYQPAVTTQAETI